MSAKRVRCAFPGCRNRAARGFCWAHVKQQQRYGHLRPLRLLTQFERERLRREAVKRAARAFARRGSRAMWDRLTTAARRWSRGIRKPVQVAEPAPLEMLLWCPACGERHLDVGEFATKRHHTHACQRCGMVWRPAVGPTVGVRFLPGFKNPEGST